MKKLYCKALLLFSPVIGQAQGGWVFETNSLSDVTQYTTIYPYTGAAFVDINNDNHIDICASPNTILINNGNGTFSFGPPLPFSEQNATSGSSWADLDNDDNIDCIVACVPSKVFFNIGNFTFADSSFLLPAFTNYGSWAVAIGDYNEDAGLDFVFAHANGYHPPSIPSPCRFYKQGVNVFDPQMIVGFPFTDNLSTYTNPFWSDYDLDGDMDLFVASGPVTAPGLDPCYRNMKIETGIDSLQPMTTELFASQTQDGQCYNFIDYDNDADLDLCITNYVSAPSRLYRNDGGGTYTNVLTPFSAATTNIANCWGDYDNDGDQDVIISNDNQISRYYRNNGNGSFVYLPGGFSTPTAICSLVNGDFDNDGDLDVFTNGVGNNGNTNSVGLYINDTVAGNRNFVNIKLVGITSNRSAIGAIVRLYATINGTPTAQMREVNAQNSFQGQNDLRVHFGLGNATVIDSLVINWPSGIVERYYNSPSNAFYQVTEGTIMIDLSARENGRLENTISIFPNPANSMFNVQISNFNYEPMVYRITNTLGAEILHEKVTQPYFSVDIGHLPAGVYNFTIQSSKGVRSERIVKF